MLPLVSELRVLDLRTFRDARGCLVPIEFESVVPFTVKRLFWITDVKPGAIRGAHAHKRCSQFFICMAGRCDFEAFDDRSVRTLELRTNQALHVRPGIFLTERLQDSSSVLAVLCDRLYEADDYLLSREELVAFRRDSERND